MAKLFIICGHGAGDSGACGYGYQEQERVRTLGKRMEEFGGNQVILGDINRNWFKDAGIRTLSISKDYQIIELHMDSSGSLARGAHVVIWHKYNPDAYDIKLANFITAKFPGRAQKIDKRSDLQNPSLAASRGYSYRLLECGFISSAEDIGIFNSNIDEIAKGILECFDITPING